MLIRDSAIKEKSVKREILLKRSNLLPAQLRLSGLAASPPPVLTQQIGLFYLQGIRDKRGERKRNCNPELLHYVCVIGKASR